MNIKILSIYLQFCRTRGFEPSFDGLKRMNKIFKGEWI